MNGRNPNDGNIGKFPGPAASALALVDELAGSGTPADSELIESIRHAIRHLEQHADRASMVAKCAIDIVEADNIIDVLHATLDKAISMIEAERGYILLWNELTKSLEPIDIEGVFDKPSRDGLVICMKTAQNSFDQGKVILNPDLRSDPSYPCSEKSGSQPVRSVLVAPLRAETNKGIERLGVIYLDSHSENHSFTDDDAELMQAFAALTALTIAHARSVGQLRLAYSETVSALVRALEAKDKYTSGHSERVAEYAVRCGQKMGLTENRLTMLRSAGLLHDVGKIGIRDSVLFKPGRLTKDEYEHIKLHADLSEDIVRGLTYLEAELNILAASQEHYDGTGYPRGTKGDEVPIESYIIQVADAWDAMTSTRVYRIALPIEKAIAELHDNAGTQFHPEVVESFLEMIEEQGIITPGLADE